MLLYAYLALESLTLRFPESDETEAVREAMDLLWQRLSPKEQDALNRERHISGASSSRGFAVPANEVVGVVCVVCGKVKASVRCGDCDKEIWCRKCALLDMKGTNGHTSCDGKAR